MCFSFISSESHFELNQGIYSGVVLFAVFLCFTVAVVVWCYFYNRSHIKKLKTKKEKDAKHHRHSHVSRRTYKSLGAFGPLKPTPSIPEEEEEEGLAEIDENIVDKSDGVDEHNDDKDKDKDEGDEKDTDTIQSGNDDTSESEF